MGNFIEDIAGAGYPRITCQECQRALVRPPSITDVGWVGNVTTFKEHHENCNGPLMNRITNLLERRGINPLPALKTAGYIHQAITTGRYNDMLGEQNQNSREVFRRLTGIKIPNSSAKRAPLFTGKPFEVKE
jgi:hypothetical protein